MIYLESLIDARFFWRDPSGTAIFNPRGKRKSGFFVDSKIEESKIRSLVELYFFAGLAVNVLGYLSGYGLAKFLIGVIIERPAAHLLEVMGIVSGCIFGFLITPALLLLRIYKQAMQFHTVGLRAAPPAADAGRAFSFALAAVGISILIIGIALAVLVRYKP